MKYCNVAALNLFTIKWSICYAQKSMDTNLFAVSSPNDHSTNQQRPLKPPRGTRRSFMGSRKIAYTVHFSNMDLSLDFITSSSTLGAASDGSAFVVISSSDIINSFQVHRRYPNMPASTQRMNQTLN